jgi:hypothetical protein
MDLDPEVERMLVTAAREGPRASLPALSGLLARAQAEVLLRLQQGAPSHDAGGTTQAGALAMNERFITAEEAAAIAGVPTRRIYEWARGQRWATRPTRRCLRISEGAFRRWFASR